MPRHKAWRGTRPGSAVPTALFGPRGRWCGWRTQRGGHGRRSAGGASAAGRLRPPVRLSGDAPVEDLRGALGAVELSLGAHLDQETSGIVAGGFGLGEGGGQGAPSGVGEDSVGVVGEGRANVLFEAVGGCGSWRAAGQVSQDGCGGLLVARLEVAQSFLDHGGLLFVASLLVPLGGGAGQVHGGEEQGDREPARLAGGVGEFLGGLAQGGGGLVVGKDGGAAGAVEGAPEQAPATYSAAARPVTCAPLMARPLPSSARRPATLPTRVTSSPSRIHTVPSPMTIVQCHRDQGSRSRRAGTFVVTVPVPAVPVSLIASLPEDASVAVPAAVTRGLRRQTRRSVPAAGAATAQGGTKAAPALCQVSGRHRARSSKATAGTPPNRGATPSALPTRNSRQYASGSWSVRTSM